MRGSRVALPQRGGPCVLAASETIRYVSRRGGYHGGASPQEVLVSLAVLVPTDIELEGWKVEIEPEPAWWSEQASTPAAAPAPVSGRRPRPTPQPGLFEQQQRPAAAAGAWIEALLASPALEAQKKLAGRSPLKDAELKFLIERLGDLGWTATPSALASALSLNAVQLGVRLAAARRLLNVEGYAVLEVDEAASIVRLNVSLLAEQFGVRAP